MANWISGNRYLSQAEMENNVLLFRDKVLSLMPEATINGIAAICGNMEKESSINPGIWENLDPYWRGYGLTQWTPYTKYSEWAGPGWENNGDKEVERLIYESRNNIQWFDNPEAPLIGLPVSPPISLYDLLTSNLDPGRLAEYFLCYYEHPGSVTASHQERITLANKWYEYLVGHPYFVPRLSKDDPTPMQGSRYWYSNYNPFWSNTDIEVDRNNWSLPNCTCYAWGRWGEISGGETLYLPTGDAGTWFPTAQSVGYYETGQVAKLGAIACYYDPTGMGHVAVVEQILPDGSIVTSNSGYYRPWSSSDYPARWDSMYFHTYHSPADYSRPGYVFQGFIYSPFSPVPPPISVDVIMGGLLNKLKRRRNYDMGRNRRITRRL